MTTTDESIMEQMLDRATNPTKEKVDELGVQMFCLVVRSNTQLVQRAQEMIMTKVRSANVTEATRGIALLEECMTQCGDVFQDEAAKFRFLNELIRLVSKKYKGDNTAIEVKQRIMECLLLWTTDFPQRQKIRDAYDMLRKEGEIEHGQATAAVAKRESVLGTIDEAMFAKLVKSKNPENFKRANLLLQYRMAQEARRNDLLAQHRLVLREVQETMQLLNQMLDTYDPSNQDVNETIHELYQSCKKHKPIFQHLPQLLDDSDAQLTADTLDANVALVAIMQRYKQLVPTSSQSTALSSPSAPASDTAAPLRNTTTTTTTTTSSNNVELLSELLGDLIVDEATPAAAETTAAATATGQDATAVKVSNTTSSSPFADGAANRLADLNDIFSAALAEGENNQGTAFSNGTSLLEPQILSPNPAIDASENDKSLSATNSTADPLRKTPGTARKMPQIDMLSEQLFQQILPTSQERMASFKRDPEKITLNDLARERMHVSPAKVTTSIVTTNADLLANHDDDPLLSDAPAIGQEIKTEELAPEQKSKVIEPESIPKPMAQLPIKHLSEISIELDEITATGEQRVVLDDDDIQMSLNFTEDRPSHQVSVIVITVQNKSRQPVKDFQFEASVKKPCKVRLLPPTESAMPPHKPFRPATPINQVMLLLNPTGKSVDITCIVGYKLGDDPDPIKESIVAQGIHYVE
ncbi:ADP-ribosylation factor-binding protein GGA1 [Drosophila tropicalis]|uniref:ADP-ribosylation factor-binding protein GGA1 n=1 Tax=Drosophila tropicalis TaxID=46794 RepID=UPI0035ABC754